MCYDSNIRVGFSAECLTAETTYYCDWMQIRELEVGTHEQGIVFSIINCYFNDYLPNLFWGK